jgi:hypothetical protein
MVRLIVEEGGERRAFRIGDGVLTVGSGEAARLRLRSSDVADLHLEIEKRGAELVLRPRPGVLPPEVAGAPVTAEVRLDLGQSIQVGSARLWLEDESKPVAAPAPAPRSAPRGAREAARNQVDSGDRAIRRQAAIEAARRSRSRSMVQRTQPRVKRGLPGWLIASLIVAAALVGGFAFRAVFRASAESGASPVTARVAAAREHLDVGNLDLAEERLDLIGAESDPTPEERARIAALREEIGERRAQGDVDETHRIGSNYLATMLQKYEQNHLQGNPDPAKVRLFLKRCLYFQDRWPRHPDGDWVRRQMSRFQGTIDLAAPPTFDDLAWEVRSLTNTMPRDYRSALALVDEFLKGATGAQALSARELRDTLVADRVEYAEDRLQQARYEYGTKQNHSGAVWWLVHSVIWLGDSDMEDRAAEVLVKIPDLDQHLRGYQEKYPDKYAAVLENPIVAGYAKKHGLPSSP